MSHTPDSLPLTVVTGDAMRMPPHPLDAEWYVNEGGQSYGPFSGHKVREMIAEGRVSTQSDVVLVGGQTWGKAVDDPVLRSLFGPTNMQGATPLALGSNGVNAAHGATIVQVTNHLAPATQVPAQNIVFEDGPAKPKSAGLAAFLSFLLVGLGQIYNGQLAKGLGMFVLCILTWFILLGWIVSIWSMIDAYRNASRMNDRYLRRMAGGMVL